MSYDFEQFMLLISDSSYSNDIAKMIIFDSTQFYS